MSRSVIREKSDTQRIVALAAQKLGITQKEVQPIIQAFWIDLDIMLNHCCGHGMYVEKFGNFIVYTKGIPGHAKLLEKEIQKNLRFLARYKSCNAPVKAATTTDRLMMLTTKLILLNYSVKQYQKDVLSTYPKKYKINLKAFEATVARVEKLLNVSLLKFPVTISYPIQKVFVRKLQLQGVLRNPIVDKTKSGKQSSKGGKV